MLPEQEHSIDEFYLTNLGKKIPYDWHRYYAAHSGKFTPDFFPDLLLMPHFEHYMNFEAAYSNVFEDKNVIPYIATAACVKTPRILLSRTAGVIRDEDNKVINSQNAMQILSNLGEVFCKSSKNSFGGSGCFRAHFDRGVDVYSGKDANLILQNLGDEFIVQDIIKCNASISSLYNKAVNTFRVITYRWKDKFYCMPVFMRIGQGGAVVDNGASGGMFIGVTSDGTLTDKAVMPYNTCIESHPDSGVIFKGYKIENFSVVFDSALKMHQMIPQVGMVYWDYTINEAGEAVLIESNIRRGTIYAIQMTHGISPFGDRTAEILQWIRKVSNTPFTRRGKYSYGY